MGVSTSYSDPPPFSEVGRHSALGKGEEKRKKGKEGSKEKKKKKRGGGGKE